MKRRKGTTSVVRIAPQRGEGRLAGGERSEPPDRRGITICTPAGVAGAPRAPAGARWSRRHGFQGFAKGAHPWLRASAEINSHFGASAGRADARRRDEGDVGHRRGAATKPIRALRRRAPAGCGPQPAAKCEFISARALRGSMRCALRWFILLAAVSALLVGPALGQAVFGGILGTVTDPSGAAVPNADITITDTDRGITYQTRS